MFIHANIRQITDARHENGCCVNQVQGKGFSVSYFKKNLQRLDQ